MNKHELALYHSPLFNHEERTPLFLHLFAELFGSNPLSCLLCHLFPRPLFCKLCFRKYIVNTYLIIEYIIKNNLPNREVYQRIVTRLEDVVDLMDVVASPEALSMETIYEVMNINMDKYDPPTPSILDACVTFTCQEKIEDCCSICLCPFEEKEQVKKLTCHHFFHHDCIMTWFKNNSTCPICKSSLKVETSDDKVVYEDYNYLDLICPRLTPTILFDFMFIEESESEESEVDEINVEEKEDL